MKRKIIILTFSLLVIAWMAFIFFFSAQTGEKSGSVSGKITEYVINLFIGERFSLFTPDRQVEVQETIGYLVRKTAHFSEYGILCLLLFFWTRAVTRKRSIVVAVPLLVSVLFAATDEFHQMFVQGRAPQAKDVLIDALGASFVMLLIITVQNILEIRRIGKKDL